jgi:hypothetical protein
MGIMQALMGSYGGGATLWGETEITALSPYLWIDASNSVFTDKSPNNHTITSVGTSGWADSVGTQNGLSTAGNSTNSKRYLSFPNITSIKTTFALVKGDSTWIDSNPRVMWGHAAEYHHHGGQSVPSGSVIEDEYSDVETWSALRENGTDDAIWGNSGNWGIKSTDWKLYAFRSDDSSTNWKFRYFGQDRSMSSRNFTGELAEALIFEGFLSTSDIEKIEGYLMHKWGLQANLDANHPYRTAAPTTTMSGDPYWSNVSLLVDGTSMADATDNGPTITVSNATSVSTTSEGIADPYGSGQNVLDFGAASNNYYVKYEHPDIAVGTGDWTLEFWIYQTGSNSNKPIIENRTNQSDSTQGWLITSQSDETWDFWYGGVRITTGVYANQLNNWHHIAISRESGTTRMFVDGNLEGSTTHSYNVTEDRIFLGAGLYSSGSTPSEAIGGYLKDIRLTKGVARYTTSFTPPNELPKS